MVRALSLGIYEKRYYHLWLNQPVATTALAFFFEAGL
jgi:hypothetical protein